jgi:hypothetical protein
MEIEFEKEGLKVDDGAGPSGVRSKTSLRMKYEAEAGLIRKKYGDLEKIRDLLGLSSRKICQLLLVDPSAWNRWTKKKDEDAPPHIYRALEWYLHLQEKNPTLDQRYWLSQITNQGSQASDAQIEQLQQQIHLLSQQIHHLQQIQTHQLQSKRRNWLQRVFDFFLPIQ